MNALRNLWTRPLCLLRQSGQNALLNITKPLETAAPLTDDCAVKNQNSNQSKFNNNNFEFNGLKFINQKFKTLAPGQISPNTLRQCRRLERKVEIAYRCKLCDTRNSKLISELAYTRGVVILQCDGCGVDHLIKDNLGWFTNTKGKTFDQVLAEQGNCSIRVIKVNEHGELI